MCFSLCQRDVASYPVASKSGMRFYVCGMCFSHCQRTYAKGRFLLATRYETISSSTCDCYTVRPAMYIGRPDFCIINAGSDRGPIEVRSRSKRTHAPFLTTSSLTRVQPKRRSSSRQKPAAVGTSQQEQAEASRSRQKPAGAGTSQQQAAKAIRS